MYVTDESELSSTPLDRLVDSLRARNVASDGQGPPAAILWTDPGREWEGLLPVLRRRLPELVALGSYEPEARTGPAIWLRCVVDGTLEPPGRPVERTPILYLPGFERGQLRAGEACPDAVRPLVELLCRGVLWNHPNGKDWTVAAFLGSPKGVGLDIAGDRTTLDALRGALAEVAVRPVAQLRARRLDAADFSEMLVGDFRRDLLRWMDDPDATRARLGKAEWAAFRRQCRDKLDFDPGAEADVVAGARFGEGRGPWAAVWERYAEAPEAYPGVEELLRRSRPAGELAFDRERWPDLNDEDEAEVRNTLSALPQRPVAEARDAVLALEAAHGHRRDWVWARLGHSPLAATLQPLAGLADTTRSAIGGAAPDDIAATYADAGWRADAHARAALARASGPDAALITSTVRHLLEPWLRDTATAFQQAMERTSLPRRGEQPLVEAREDECLVFVDGLRYELGRDLAGRLEQRGCEVSPGHRWAAIPTVTATGKPAVTPVADLVEGDALGPDFRPAIRRDGGQNPPRPALAVELRKAMEERGYQIVGDGTLDLPLAVGARGWLETGKIDKFGHDHDAATFARLVDQELDALAERIAQLLDAGWRSVRIVTDHGWLWLPGGLPMVTLPKYLTESQWSRCAVVSGDSAPDIPRHPWHWSESQWFATPPDIACFSKRDEYAHGGLSVQECLIPDIRVERTAESGVAATIRSITWRRLRCYAEVEVRGPDPVTADLRIGSPSGASVALTAKPVEDDGSVSLVLADDKHEQAALVLVVTDTDGRILSQHPTRVGENS